MLTSLSIGRTRCYLCAVLLVTLCVGVLRVGPVVDASTPAVYYQSSQQQNETYISFESSSGASASEKRLNNGLLMHDGSVGEQRIFWLQNFTDFTHYQEQATLLGTGAYSAVFITNTCISIVGETKLPTNTNRTVSFHQPLIARSIKDLWHPCQ
jgi:hypothetical protein